MPLALVISTGPDRGKFLVVGAEGCVLGRGSDSPLVLREDHVSRRHIQVVCEGGAYMVSDLGTTNGTRLNGEPVLTPARLADGDELIVGTDMTLRVFTETPTGQEHAARLLAGAPVRSAPRPGAGSYNQARPLATIMMDARAGRHAAQDEMVGALYADLRAMAAAHLQRERRGHILQPTALVNEAWIRLSASEGLDKAGKTMFMAAAAETFRRVLVDYARSSKAKKRGGGAPCVSLEDGDFAADAEGVDAQWLYEVLEQMEREHPRWHKIVQLKCFGGLEVAHIAELIGVSERTVANEWASAREWMQAKARR